MNLTYPLPYRNREPQPKHKHSSYETKLRIWPTHLPSRNRDHQPKHTHSSYETKLRIWPSPLPFRNREPQPKHKHSSYQESSLALYTLGSKPQPKHIHSTYHESGLPSTLSNGEPHPKHKHSTYETNLRIWPTKTKTNINIVHSPNTHQHGVAECNQQLHLFCCACVWKYCNVKRVHGHVTIIGIIFVLIGLD